MKDEVIDRVFDELENEINSGYLITIPVVQKNKEWDLYDSFGYSLERGVNELIKHEGSDVCKLVNKGTRSYVIFEYKRPNKGGNQPQRHIVMGELLSSSNDEEIHVKGTTYSYRYYANHILQLNNIIDRLVRLDAFKIKFIENMKGLHF